ncbi:MAG: response regulator [Frisingicoccus sp.]|uniref:ATP-binding protein n=1 Tax=Frisingicoccus sp. TaxID=1918627 RepID=UPI0026354DAC|nr:ATP-binding protein [Frisingicoccus sp.]MDD6233128.1 response regulator [Frisingicoccus sp.]MDY4835424.1 response regulator [Frisingicoccus sp.]
MSQHENILCDKTKVREIYLNILSNSLKYTNSGGKVDFSISEEKADIDHHVIYKVIFSDTGIGMSKEYLEMIYDQFSRERSTTEAGISGTGLGMTIVKKLVDLMKGSIHIESELGKGTRIRIRIPFEIAKESQKEMHEVSSFDNEPLSFTGKRILLAEDNNLNAEIAIELLHESGFYVEHAHDGVECIDMLKIASSDYYDGILMDIQMPNLNGYEATEYIRKMDDLKKAQIPIIAMTANAFIEDVQKCLDAGMNAHIAKPISMDEIIKTISKFL